MTFKQYQQFIKSYYCYLYEYNRFLLKKRKYPPGTSINLLKKRAGPFNYDDWGHEATIQPFLSPSRYLANFKDYLAHMEAVATIKHQIQSGLLWRNAWSYNRDCIHIWKK